MSPEAQRRLDVYQEGQRAFNAGTQCPYTDWRAGTWEKGRAAAEAHAAALVAEDSPPLSPKEEMLKRATEARSLGELRDVLIDLINEVHP